MSDRRLALADTPGARRRRGAVALSSLRGLCLLRSLRAVRLLGLVSVTCALAAPASLRADALAADPADRLQETELENGLRVLTLEDHSTPVVAFQMWVLAGSKDESSFSGIAHLFEHMMFKGSKHVGEEEHARLIGARGGQVNAYTTNDVTVYFDDVTRETLPLVIELEAERLGNLDISQANLDDEREVVLEERRLRTEDDPNGLAFQALAAQTFQGHPYGWPVIGWRADVEGVTVEACRRFFDTYYAPNNILLVIVGDFDTPETIERIERAFGRLKPAAEIPRRPAQVVPQRGERREIVHYDVRVPLLYVAWQAPASGHPDAEALDVTSQILSAGRSSRLYRSLVYEQELALYAEGGYWELQHAGLFYGVAGVRPGVGIDTVERAFYAVIDRIARDGVDPAEVEKAKRKLEVALVDGLATTHALAGRIGNDMVLLGRVRPLGERLDAIQAVTAADVQRVVARYLVEDTRSVVQVVPPAAAGPTPVAAAAPEAKSK